jgi:anti-sigma-K factor RskA
MERQGIHELSAAYALHALDSDEERAFEEHLAHCDDCREQVAAFQETAAAMAHDGDPAAPPAGLRGRILAEARRERPQVVQLRERRRWTSPATAGFAATAACAAIALGIWSLSLSSSLSDERAALDRADEAVSVLAQADARRIPLSGAEGLLVVNRAGEAWLVVSGLEAATGDKTYEAWVIEDGDAVPAGLFHGGGSRTIVKLSRQVPAGSGVAVTLERAGGVDQPTREPVFTSAQTA